MLEARSWFMRAAAAALLAVALMSLLAQVLLEEWFAWSQAMVDKRRAATWLSTAAVAQWPRVVQYVLLRLTLRKAIRARSRLGPAPLQRAVLARWRWYLVHPRLVRPETSRLRLDTDSLVMVGL